MYKLSLHMSNSGDSCDMGLVSKRPLSRVPPMDYKLLPDVLESALLGVAELSDAGIVLACNSAWSNLLLLEPGRMCGQSFEAFVDPEHRPRWSEAWETLVRNGRSEVDLHMLCQGGVSSYLRVWLIQMGQHIHALAIDTTLQSEQEKYSKETLLLQRSIINCANFGMMSTDLQGNLKSLNATAERWLDYVCGDLPHLPRFDELLVPAELAALRRQSEARHGNLAQTDFDLLVYGASHGLDDEGEWHLRSRDETLIPVLLTIKALISEEGELTGYLMVAADLREHKQMQQRLIETEALFTNAFDAAANAIAIVDLHGMLIRANPAFFHVLQREVHDHIAIVLAEYLDAESWQQLGRCCNALLQDNAPPLQEEFQIAARGGPRVWVDLSMALMKDERGAPLYYVLQMQDISERRRVDGELKLAASVFNSSSEGVYIADQNGIIISVNPAFTQITAWQPDEVVGQHVSFFQSDDLQPAEFYAEIKRSLLDVNFWQGELWTRVKDGRAVLTRLSITRILNESGKAQRFVAVFNDITELRQKDERLLYQAYHDALTDLPNRVMLTERMLVEFQRAQRKRLMVALLFLDIDHFKYTNDTLGHDVGDMLLRSVASRLLGTVRESDLVARLGGDEFVVLLPEVAELKNVSLVAQKITESMTASFHLQGHDLRITVSIGISVFPQDSMSPTTLLRHGDTAMYRAKEQGRNNAQFYTPTLDRQIKERFVMETSLRRALERNEFLLYYQPKLDFRTGHIIGAEALLRWKHPEMGMVPPGQFIALAEETGLIAPIGDWVLAVACKDTKRWRDMGYENLCVAVNLSARQFRQTDLVQRIQLILEETGLDASGLELELTESMIMHNPQETIVALHRLKEMGMSLAVDDFGTGYSSLSYLKRFPIDTLKIDRSFVNDIHTDADDAAITVTIINLAKSLRLSVVAEGVETREQFDFLNNAGCEYMQGYFFSRPVPADEFEQMLISDKQMR